MILHTINKSSQANKLFIQCCSVLEDGDKVILLGDAVELAKKDTDLFETLVSNSKLNIEFFVLQDHVNARKLTHSLHDEITVINYAVFVELAANSGTCQSWY